MYRFGAARLVIPGEIFFPGRSRGFGGKYRREKGKMRIDFAYCMKYNKQKQETARNLTEAVRFGGRIPESKKHGPGYAAAADGPEY